MKKLLIYATSIIVLLLNTAAGCGSNTDTDPQPDNFTSLLGKWEAIRARYEIVKQDGFQINPELKIKNEQLEAQIGSLKTANNSSKP